MSTTHLDYDQMLQDAMRGIVRTALAQTAENGIPGDHHFYITFRTTAPGVHIPAPLTMQFPDEMTIVLEHQFWNLSVSETGFSVDLSFGGKRQRLQIPFSAVIRFVDPSVNFGLEFKETDPGAMPDASSADADTGGDHAPGTPAQDEPENAERAGSSSDDEAPGADKVVSLDQFRKK